MRSKAHIKGHPLHPILVSFPITLFTAAFVFDLLGLFIAKPEFQQIALYAEIGGLASGLIAALPGLVDFIYIVPPESSANKRAIYHGLINSTAIIIFLMALLLRQNISLTWITILEGCGFILILTSGWLGGTLLVRNQIGIDHRYANAGKWQDESIQTKEKKIRLKDIEKLQLNQMKLLRVNDRRIVIGKTEKGLVAFDDRCTHKGGGLSDGVMICNTVQCPWHGSQFNVNTGEVKAGPAKSKIKTYTITSDKNIYWLEF